MKMFEKELTGLMALAQIMIYSEFLGVFCMRVPYPKSEASNT
jgi:hypothetical protein